MFGLQDMSNLFTILERGVTAMERMADALEGINEAVRDD